ncbi:hypothetical protein [Aestuariicoccus sp. MJ-SS9]|uniref:hypothetical protein n=1 Tax=Aestuariicoccus sp. MJ-SS9 TaxID=3079855 RepID=UPI00290E5B17|nr:hypothetical protein [Aestuariicoccus sp. MJ-SS9]MDU8913469.1 hypothetical protein [Aestuariicoccus sp. MJ-SS9]
MKETIATTAEAHEDDAMPRKVDVHCDPCDESPGAEDLPAAVTRKPVEDKSPAEWAYERLILYIQGFEEQLDNEHEVAVGFAGSDAGVLRIEGLGFFDPDIVTFYGEDPAGARTQLIQNVSQLSVILRALPKAVQREAPRRIGFRLAEALDRV